MNISKFGARIMAAIGFSIDSAVGPKQPAPAVDEPEPTSLLLDQENAYPGIFFTAKEADIIEPLDDVTREECSVWMYSHTPHGLELVRATKNGMDLFSLSCLNTVNGGPAFTRPPESVIQPQMSAPGMSSACCPGSCPPAHGQ